jgi:thiamine phosphate synthase YjbQ (UPF0047 family)
MTSEIDIETKNEQEMLDITSLVEKELKENDAKNGICFLYCPHTTCGIAINEGPYYFITQPDMGVRIQPVELR